MGSGGVGVTAHALEAEIKRRREAAGDARQQTFIEWCEELGRAGLKIDGKPFTLKDRPALVPLYQAIPSTRAEARHKTIVLQKGSQLGATVWEILADLYMASRWEPITVGMFLPDQATASYKSENRFMRLLRTIPRLHRRLITRGAKAGANEGNILTRVMGESTFLFLWVTGRVSTESRPMDAVTLDEVQEMTLEQIDKTRERMSASDIRFSLMLSTANWPEADINFWFLRGTQNIWHTECPRCRAETDLSEHFPACVQYNDGTWPDAPHNDYLYVCPECNGYIADTQRGRYIAHNPTALHVSYHLSQIISPTISPRDMIEAWNQAITGDQRKTFFNRKLGKPYVDKDQLPVSMADCLACVAEGKRLGLVWQLTARGALMGIDQMGGFNAVIIKGRLPDGRQAVLHCEAIFDPDPFQRCSELMEQYGVVICVVEGLPNWNDAHRFAVRHAGKVFVASYTEHKDDMLVWGDDMSRSDRRTAPDDRSRYAVSVHQYRAMQVSLTRIAKQMCLFPDPSLLEQDVMEGGKRKRIALLRDWVFVHFTKTALVMEEDPESRRPKPRVKKIGLDPHYSFANMLCDIAWARNYGTGMVILPTADDAKAKPAQGSLAEKVQRKMPGLPRHVLAMIEEPGQGTCGRCSAFEAGKCVARNLNVGAGDIGCVLYDARVS